MRLRFAPRSATEAYPSKANTRFSSSLKAVSVGLARIDLVVDRAIVVEIKSVEMVTSTHFAQLRSYLRATRLRVGLLMNFNNPTLAIRRMVLD